MNLFLRHRLYRVLSIASVLNSLGSYIYNLVFVIYAASLPYSNVAVFIANMITMVPTIFTFWVGVRADRTGKKGQTMIVVGVIQALLFTLVAFLIGNQTFLVFSVICLLNIVADVLSNYAAGLKMPILQYNVDSEDLMEAYSFSQFLFYVASMVGQAFGVWLLTVSHQNFALVALINAVSFLLSGLVLWQHRKDLTHEPVAPVTEKTSLWRNFIETYHEMEGVFRKSGNMSFLGILFSILAINTIGGSIAPIYNFYFLHHDFFGLTYGQSLLVVEVLSILAAILGTLTPKDYFSRQSLSFLIMMCSSGFVLTALSNLVGLPTVVGLIFLTFSSYIFGKSSPKLDALIMANLPSQILAQGSNFLSMLFTLSLPLGTFVFSSLALYNLFLCWSVFVLLAFLSLYLTVKNFKAGEES